ncbi:MAG: L-fucose isomerase-like protein, partial [Solirubrobacterales bacterium]|nr:L-fucose isomerase-like protein [Solirubrobacterales bacterium]
PTMRIGNTNSRLVFGLGPAELLERWCAEGPTHHVALGVGHHLEELRCVARLLGLPLSAVRA